MREKLTLNLNVRVWRIGLRVGLRGEPRRVAGHLREHVGCHL